MKIDYLYIDQKVLTGDFFKYFYKTFKDIKKGFIKSVHVFVVGVVRNSTIELDTEQGLLIGHPGYYLINLNNKLGFVDKNTFNELLSMRGQDEEDYKKIVFANNLMPEGFNLQKINNYNLATK